MGSSFVRIVGFYLQTWNSLGRMLTVDEISLIVGKMCLDQYRDKLAAKDKFGRVFFHFVSSLKVTYLQFPLAAHQFFTSGPLNPHYRL